MFETEPNLSDVYEKESGHRYILNIFRSGIY